MLCGERTDREQPAGVHELPARTWQGCVGKLPESDDGCDVDAGDGKFPEHGEQRRAAARRARQRKLRSRNYAVVLPWIKPVESGRNASARQQRKSDPDVYTKR